MANICGSLGEIRPPGAFVSRLTYAGSRCKERSRDYPDYVFLFFSIHGQKIQDLNLVENVVNIYRKSKRNLKFAF